MDDSDLTGSQKAAVFLMAMGENRSNRLKLEMDSDEVEELRDAMESLGKVPSGTVENIISEYDVKRSALPMNQPQNVDLREKQEQDQARKRPAQKSNARQPKRTTAEIEAEANGISPTVPHMTNIEV
jgi:hypothetical protein